MRPYDGKTLPVDIEVERLTRAWYAYRALTTDETQITLADYFRLEDIMEKWYVDGKMAKTGHAAGETPGADLSHHCDSYNFRADDRLTYFRVTSNLEGIPEISIQTVK